MRTVLRTGISLLIVLEIVIGIWQYRFDIAGLGLGMVLALALAAVSLDPRLLKAALTMFAAYSSAHFIYQVLHFDEGRAVVFGLLAEVLVAIGLLAAAHRANRLKTDAAHNVAYFVPGHEAMPQTMPDVDRIRRLNSNVRVPGRATPNEDSLL
jgi:hypothetical protein